jgi:signal transduction histidine kinase
MSPAVDSNQERVIVLAPNGRDAYLIVATLCDSGIFAEAVPTIQALCEELDKGVGATILTEEALQGVAQATLTLALGKQPAWSDLPVIILTTGGVERAEPTWQLVRKLEPVGNVSLMERPLRPITLVSAVHVALRSRRRQYEVRSLYERLERRVAERTAELERLNREAEGFNYSISHDLRSPLRSINATANMLMDEYGDILPPEAKALLQRQAIAATRLASLIDDLLRLSRLSRQEMHWHDFDLTALAHDVIGEVRSESKRWRFVVQENMTARGDALLLRFVLLNLIENACKFSPHGGTITVGQDPDGVFYVNDEGIGFEPIYKEKLFLPFERLVHESEFPGTGIGLANVKRIVDRHGGSVWADGVPGKGATFFFTLG